MSAPAQYKMSSVQLLFLSVGSIIGSGWLVAASAGAAHAGPAVLVTWCIATGCIFLLAIIHAELGAMFGVKGGSARFPHYAFGSVTGFVSGWLTFLSAAAVAPVEVAVAWNYATPYIGALAVSTSGSHPVMTGPGLLAAALLLLVFTLLNQLGIRLLAGVNAVVVGFKIAVPLVAAVALILVGRHWSNFTASGGFLPNGFPAIFTALASAGILFASQGFEQAVQFGSETRDPRRNIPLAVIGSIVISAVIYILLQIGFIGALSSADLSAGWRGIALGSDAVAPVAALVGALGLGWLALFVYVDAVISPSGTGLVFVGSATRLLTTLAEKRYIPRWFRTDPTRPSSWPTIVTAYVLGLLFMLPDTTWQGLIVEATLATVLSYALQPLALAALRRQVPDEERPFRLWYADVLAPAGFVVSNEIMLFGGWDTYWKLAVAVGIGMVLLLLSAATARADPRPALDFRNALWLWPYLAGLGVILYFSSQPFRGPGRLPFGAQLHLPFGVDMVAVLVLSLGIYVLAVRHCRLPGDRADRYIELDRLDA